jgi:hypothetical protein
MQSIEEHQEIPKEEAAVMPGRGPRKRCKVRNLAAERCQKPKERTRGYRGSQKRLIVVYRKMSRHATVAWHKRHIVRKNWIRSKVERTTQIVGLLRKNLRSRQEGCKATKNLDPKKKATTAVDIGGWSSEHLSPLGRGGPTYKILKMTLKQEIVKQIAGSRVRLQKIKNSKLSRGRPLRNEKRSRK